MNKNIGLITGQINKKCAKKEVKVYKVSVLLKLYKKFVEKARNIGRLAQKTFDL
ncbi:MAG: hypothetical protein GX386_03530 [Clostridiaceae bacterium]|jgi:hypothetical protein|nr:hypothetical protein [Clostridiaceae bacterium]